MKVVTLNPPFLPKFSRTQRSPAVTKSGTLYYPIWLSYATGVLEQDDHEVRLFDAVAADLSVADIRREVGELRPQLLLVDTSTPSILNDIEVATLLKEDNPDMVVGLVGGHVTAAAEETLRSGPGIDFTTLGEYDYTVCDVARAIAGGEDWREVAGQGFLDGEEFVLRTGRDPIWHLDELPFVSEVYHRHLPYKKYFYAITRWPVVTIISGRGCPYKCHFCYYPQTLTGQRYRTRSYENVAEEMERIEKLFPQAKEVFIEDDTLTLNRKRCRQLSEELIRRQVKIKWTCNARCDVDLETMKAMHTAGCRLLCVGVESGVQEILDNVEKGIQKETISQFFTDVKKSGLLVHACFMAGNPGETRDTMEQTLEFAKTLNPDTAQFFPLMVYPGTRAYEWAKANNYLRADSYRDWLTADGMHNSVVERPELPHQDIVGFCDRARREFYLRWSYIAFKLRQMLRHPSEAQRLLKSFSTFYRYLLRK